MYYTCVKRPGKKREFECCERLREAAWKLEAWHNLIEIFVDRDGGARGEGVLIIYMAQNLGSG